MEDEDLYEALQDFAQTLIEHQEDLPPEFRKILNEKSDELYD